jgi:ApaG protein
MPTRNTIDAVTAGVRVSATPFFLADESAPDEGRYVFGYRIVIANEGDATVQLLSRHWLIIDAEGNREDVRGPGVVGQTPVLKPGQSFEYTSRCPLETPWGTMEGSYRMRRDDGELFEAKVARFYLRQTEPEWSVAPE